ncbi:MAG: dTDP-4-dehydrorhamnose reductase [Nitrospinota bacterium]
MKLLITGAGGGLGSQFLELAGLDYPDWECVGVTRELADLLSPADIKGVISDVKPDCILHAAAMAAVDLCETEPELAHDVNVEGTRALVEAAENVNARVVFISTDYVYDGTKNTPYHEEDHTQPLGVYGKTKLEAEHIVDQMLDSTIIRTSWLYGKTGKNFVKTMRELVKKKNRIEVVTDQVGAPTYYLDLCEAIALLIDKGSTGLFHVVNSGYCTWFEFAKAIFEEKNIDVELAPVTSPALDRPAPRPANSRLDCSRYEEETGKKMRHWRDALRDFLKYA